MTDTHHEEHKHPNYWAIFGALIVLTTVSFITVLELWKHNLGESSGHTVVMVVAVCKALLVALFFMHLKYDWFKVYYFVVPALLMGTVLICALMPDITFAQGIKFIWLPVGAE